jgi:uncharacterized repeat protein (TIGR03803 family)
MAILTTIVSPGSQAVAAVYGGTAASRRRCDLTAKANAKNPKNYDFTASVSGFGLAAPTKTVVISDVTANTDLGTAALDSKTVSHSLGNALVTNAAGAPVQSVVADFNGDGFPDVATTNAAQQPAKTHMQSATSVRARAIVFVLVLVASGSAQAQTFTVLYTFTNPADGEQPDASLFLDAAGNLYGTTQYGGTKGGFGTVFKVNTKGREAVLRSFAGTPRCGRSLRRSDSG